MNFRLSAAVSVICYKFSKSNVHILLTLMWNLDKSYSIIA